MPVRIILADDHEIVRQGLKTLLEQKGFEVVGEASNGQEGIRLCKELRPDIAVLDLTMPLVNGIDAAREILKDCPRIKVVLLTMHTEEHYVLHALQAGIAGYVVKTQAASDLVQALDEVSRGSMYVSSKVSRAIVLAYLEKRTIGQDILTPRERQVLQLIAEGKTTKGLAHLLSISYKTTDAYRTRIMNKLDTHNTAGLVHQAIRQGLVHA